MNDNEKWDRLFKQALASEVEPDEELNQKLINSFKEGSRMKRGNRKRFSVGVLVVVLSLVLSVSVYAATQLFSSKEVAEHIGDDVLAQAFESSDAIEVNQTVASGGFNFTLHGVVSGTGLSELGGSAQEIHPDRTYAVVSIAKQDGSPMPSGSDPEYGKEQFLVSPLIKGQKPWQVNIMSMKGSHSEVIRDGIMYRLIECDGVEKFADRGVYMGVISGGFINNESFVYNEDTGEISANTNNDEISILFDLPLDITKADSVKADTYLQELLKVPSKEDVTEPATSAEHEESVMKLVELKKKIPDGTVIPESVKEVTYNDEGRMNYEYNGWSVEMSPEMLFSEGHTNEFVTASVSGANELALQFSKDKQGVITGRVLTLK